MARWCDCAAMKRAVDDCSHAYDCAMATVKRLEREKSEMEARLATLEGQTCETCQHQDRWQDGMAFCGRLPGPSCEYMGNRCGAWAALDTGGESRG
jgi:hypothetical protein